MPTQDLTFRPALRDLGLTIGRFPTGPSNAITDLKGVRVGHVTHIQDDVPVPGTDTRTKVRTGVTAVLPAAGDVYNNRLAAGGFVLNGVGDMTGLNQVLEWGWLETPILLTNTMSVGRVHAGTVLSMMKRYPKLGLRSDVILPVVGETDDSFLNDARIPANTEDDAVRAILSARSGPVTQGSVGAGTGMMTFDFAGGIGTSSRVVDLGPDSYLVGVLVLSNFGRMRNLTVEGAVVGRELDRLLSGKGRREDSYGSVIVVVGTNAPLLSSQLNRVSKRAALGLGRVGSHAASTSGEIVVAFSTRNRSPRHQLGKRRYLLQHFISDVFVNELYEATIEATEEAVLNAISTSAGTDGRAGHRARALPVDKVFEILRRGRRLKALARLPQPTRP
ncbi:MAG: P1 family peptidase [candidate division WOR-3 bacterium]|nr:MAG: P1 family peptidase [candidate division WOR-3 bacterium]